MIAQTQASHNLTLAEVVAGTVVMRLPRVGILLSEYPKLSAWCDRFLVARTTWQATEATPEAIWKRLSPLW